MSITSIPYNSSYQELACLEKPPTPGPSAGTPGPSARTEGTPGPSAGTPGPSASYTIPGPSQAALNKAATLFDACHPPIRAH